MKLDGPFRIVIEGDTAKVRRSPRSSSIGHYIMDRLLWGEEVSVAELESWGLTVREEKPE